MICPHCKKEIENDSIFCPICGEKIDEIDSTPQEEVKEEVEEVVDAKETNEDIDIEEIDTDVKEEDTYDIILMLSRCGSVW